jgi:hypothetical protein
MYELRKGDKLKLVKKNDFAGFKGHKVGEIATFQGWLKDGDDEKEKWFKLRWSGEKTNAVNPENRREWLFLMKKDDKAYWEFAYDENTKQRQNEYLVKNI